MRFAFFLFTTALLAQDETGARIFRQTCAQGYCHGSGGTQGRAPKLIGRAYDAQVALKIINDGVPNTGMPGFKDRLSSADVNNVLAYVVKISGGDMNKLPMTSSSIAVALPNEIQAGRDAFFDALRGVNRCGTCHALDGQGVAIGPNLASGTKYDATAIQKGKPATIRQATVKGTVKGDSFPALLVDRKPNAVRVYDLTVIPPPLRTFAPADITFAPATSWSHANVIKGYSAADLDSIVLWLNWLNTRQ